MLTQLLAASASSDDLKRGIYEGFEPWMRLLEGAVTRVLGDTPWSALIQPRDLAFAMSSLFIGIEMMAGLDTQREAEQRLFATIESLGALVDTFLRVTPPSAEATPRVAAKVPPKSRRTP